MLDAALIITVGVVTHRLYPHIRTRNRGGSDPWTISLYSHSYSELYCDAMTWTSNSCLDLDPESWLRAVLSQLFGSLRLRWVTRLWLGLMTEWVFRYSCTGLWWCLPNGHVNLLLGREKGP